MRRLQVLTVLVAFVVASFVLPAQQIETGPDGNQIVKFTPGQQAAIDRFLNAHPNLIQANCANFELSPKDCAASYSDWHRIVVETKAAPQSQYAAWGNYSHHPSADLVIPFFSKTSVNNWGWRRWQIVVFESIGENQYKPIVALTDS